MAKHTEHGGSAWPRIARCPGSVLLSRGAPRKSTEFSKEGTLCHAAAEYCLVNRRDAIDVVRAGFLFDVSTEHDGTDMRSLPEELSGCVQEYVDNCRYLPGDHFVEQTLSFDPWVPENIGSVDHLALVPDERLMIITDAKFGAGVVIDAEYNEQMLMYAIAAYEEHSLFYPIDTVTMRICQPKVRSGTVDWTISAQQLMGFWAPLFRYLYWLSLSPDAPLVAGEKQCKFCPAHAQCPVAAERMLALVADELAAFDPDAGITVANADLLSLARVEEIYRASDSIRQFLSAVASRMYAAKLSGEDLPGWKFVQGRGTRAWVADSEPRIQEIIGNSENIYNKQLKSPAQIEKIVGKKKFKELVDLVETKQGALKLAPAEDKRPEIVPAHAELDGFDSEEIEQ